MEERREKFLVAGTEALVEPALGVYWAYNTSALSPPIRIYIALVSRNRGVTNYYRLYTPDIHREIACIIALFAFMDIKSIILKSKNM